MNCPLEQIVEQELAPLGLELFELRRGGSAGRPVLDVRIDRTDGSKVTVGNCATASRAIEARLDRENLVGERYVLEVSSPGIERALRHAGDWRRFAGRRALVTSAELGGSREVEIVSVDGEGGDAVARVRLSSGEEVGVPLASVTAARLVFRWKQGS